MNDRESPSPALTVRKRDGQIEPFNPAKLVDCLRRALYEASDADPPATATGLAEAVAQFLARSGLTGPINAAQIAQLVETVLAQTGYNTAGLLLRQFAQRRDRLRRQLHVAHFRPAQARFVNRRWSKSTVVASLRQKHGLGTPVARRIAGLVESAVLRSGMRVITTGLIEQMIVSEMLAWGLLPAALATRKQGRRSSPAPRERHGAEQSE